MTALAPPGPPATSFPGAAIGRAAADDRSLTVTGDDPLRFGLPAPAGWDGVMDLPLERP